MKYFLLLLLFPFFLFAKDPSLNVSAAPKCAYTPWYTGSLIATSGHCVSKGQTVFQPYLIVRNNYGIFTQNWKYANRPDTIFITPLALVQGGITDWMDYQLLATAHIKFQGNQHAIVNGDWSFLLGFQLLRDIPGTPIPYLRFIITETFPTGKYRKLNPRKLGTDLGGIGSFQTQFGFALQKLFCTFPNHPIRIRVNATYSIPSKVHVKGFNAFGGGFDTDETVTLGNTVNLVFAPEFSITQRWVFAFDIVYQHQEEGSFSGFPGVDMTGRSADTNVQRNDLMQFTPSIEYSFNANFGMIFGAWLQPIGRNVNAFAGGMLSFVAEW